MPLVLYLDFRSKESALSNLELSSSRSIKSGDQGIYEAMAFFSGTPSALNKRIFAFIFFQTNKLKRRHYLLAKRNRLIK